MIDLREIPLLARLLGPSDPQLSCEECFEQLDRYIELEFAGGDAQRALSALRAHLEGCAACREEYESLKALLEADARSEGGENSALDP